GNADRDCILWNITPPTAMEFVPPAEDRPPIRIRFSFNDRMMNAVHPWGDDDKVQDPLEPDRQPPIRMMKTNGGFKCDEEDNESHRSNANKKHDEREETDRKEYLAEMETRGGSHIHVEIGVVNIVKAPEKRNHVIGPVPPPVGVIHQSESRDGGESTS